MNIFSTVWNYIIGGSSASGTDATKTLEEFLTFFAGLPYTQIVAAALAEGTNIPLDITTAATILADANKAFFSGQSVQTATIALTTKVGIPTAVAEQIVFAPDPIHPIDPTQFSRGR